MALEASSEPSGQHRLDQEELLSLHRSFPEIESIGLDTGAFEVELVQVLFLGTLLSKRTLPQQREPTMEAMARAILPGMNKPRRIEEDRALLPLRSRAEAIRRELVSRGMDLFESVRDATPV